METAKYYWIDAVKFDACQHKVRALSMMENLLRMGFDITYVTSYLEKPVAFPHFHYLDTATRTRGLYRIAFFAKCIQFLREKLKRKERIVLIVFPQTFYIGMFAKMLSWLYGTNIPVHLDFRTVPVKVGTNNFKTTLKYSMEWMLFWMMPILLSRLFARTYSFITERIRQLVGTGGKPFAVWTSGVRSEELTLAEPIREYPEGSSFELLYLGSMSDNRGVEEIVTAIANSQGKLDGVVLRIVGGGAGSDRIQNLIQKYRAEKQILFEGPVPHEKVPSYLNQAHAFISPLPDHPWWRVSSPIKLFEYLATGRPLILTDIPPHRDVIPNGLPGIVWLPDLSAESVISSIRKMRKEYDALSQRWDERKRIAELYTWQAQANRLGEFFNKHYSK